MTGRYKGRGAFGADTVMQIGERDSWRCVRCAVVVSGQRGWDWAVHHRRARAAGGSRRADTSSPANGLIVCTGCHAWIESRRGLARIQGWLVRQGHDPAGVSVWTDVHGGWVRLDHDGGVTPAEEVTT